MFPPLQDPYLTRCGVCIIFSVKQEGKKRRQSDIGRDTERGVDEGEV